jgi:hypothetical protein
MHFARAAWLSKQGWSSRLSGFLFIQFPENRDADQRFPLWPVLARPGNVEFGRVLLDNASNTTDGASALKGSIRIQTVFHYLLAVAYIHVPRSAGRARG